MSKRKKRGRSPAMAAMFRSIFGSGVGERADLDDALSMLGRALASDFAFPAHKPPKSSIWRDYLQTIIERNSRNFPSRVFNGKFSIDKVYANGMISGHILDAEGVIQGNLFAFAAMPSDHQFPFGCSCARSQGKYVCEHTRPFLDFLINALKDPSSNLF